MSASQSSGTSADEMESSNGTGRADAIRVIPFVADMDAPEHRRLSDLPDRVTDGDPHHTSQMRYTNAEGALQAGTWTSTPGRWRTFADRDEFCSILSGRGALISLSGDRLEFGPGDAFLIPDGFEGYWEITETATKHFVILHR